MVFVVFFFFFKQKTAYEMRISDWSSDVCSSDLRWCCRSANGSRWCGCSRCPAAAVPRVRRRRIMPGSELTPPVPLSTAKEKLSPSRARGRLWSESDSQLSLGVDAPAPRGIEATHQSSRTAPPRRDTGAITHRSEEHTSELQSLMRIS